MLLVAVLFCPLMFGCESTGKVSVAKSQPHLLQLVKLTASDVLEIRTGLPLGAKRLEKSLAEDLGLLEDPELTKKVANRARNKVQDLRMAKSTFFAVATPDGRIIRNDREQDLMAGKSLFPAWDGLKPAVEGKYTETRGSLPEAAGVAGRPDAQWVAASPVQVEGKTRALFVTGWSWAGYCYRLENALKTLVTDEIKQGDGRGKMPLFYVFVIDGGKAYGSRVAPKVNLETLQKMGLPAKLKDGVYATPIEITGRSFGLVAASAPALGEGVLLAILRSET